MQLYNQRMLTFDFVRGTLLFGPAMSNMWSVYRIFTLGIIVCCNYSLKQLKKVVELNTVEKGPQNSLEDWKWSAF